jgi:mannose-6-phosphate isomerase-like protein (cupin superfamily)
VVVAAAGSMIFVTPDGEVTASAGDLMTVPPGAVHTFKNASETEDCECYMTATPGKITRAPCLF